MGISHPPLMSNSPLKRGSMSTSILNAPPTNDIESETSRRMLKNQRALSAGCIGSGGLAARGWSSQRPVDSTKSLYIICAYLIQMLQNVPDLGPYISYCYYDHSGSNASQENAEVDLGFAPPGYPLDPVSHIWRIIRLGAPLCILFNYLGLHVQLEVLPPENCKEAKVAKRLLYRFLEACMAELGMSAEVNLFTLTNVFKNSSGDLLKVLKTTQHVMNLVRERRKLSAVSYESLEPPAPRDAREKVVYELMQTERKYVQDLELLGEYRAALINANMPDEIVSRIFPYFVELLDFQRIFLAGIEYVVRLPPEDVMLGSLFLKMKQRLKVYEGYTLNQKKATDLALSEVGNLMPFSHILEPVHELPAMLIKPVQRICKYPLLLKQVLKHTPPEWPCYKDIEMGLEIVQEATQTVNEMQRRIENGSIYQDLKERVKDWKNLDISQMGNLLLSGIYTIISHGEERETHIFLFDRILLCCRDEVQGKKMAGLGMIRTRQSRRFSLDIKGRIYTSYITNIHTTKDNGHLLTITWGQEVAPVVGSVSIRFGNEEQLLLWESTLKRVISDRRNSSFLPEILDAYEDYEKSTQFYDDTALSPVESLSKMSVSTHHRHSNSIARSLSASKVQTNVLPAGRSSSGSSGQYVLPLNLRDVDSSYASRPGSYRQGSSSGESRQGYRRSSNLVDSPHSARTNSLPYNNVTGSVPNFSGSAYVKRSSNMSISQSAFSASSVRLQSPSSNNFDIGVADSPGVDQVYIRVYFNNDTFLISATPDVTYEQLLSRVIRKIKLCGKQAPVPMRLKYRDEDDDFVNLSGNEDLTLALETAKSNSVISLYVI